MIRVLRALFGFKGRLSRAGHLWWTAAYVGGAVVLAIATVLALTLVKVIGGSPEERLHDVGVGIVLALFAVCAWCWLATVTKRLRDAGLKPLIVLPIALIMLMLLPPILNAAGLPVLFWPVVGLLNLSLILLPSRGASTEDVADAFT